MSLSKLTALELGRKIQSREVGVKEAVSAALESISKYDKDINAFITVDGEGALKRADEIQDKINAGKLTNPLAGVPVAIKDNGYNTQNECRSDCRYLNGFCNCAVIRECIGDLNG